MKPFKFIHTADLHLDSPFKELSEVDNTISSELTESTFNAFDNLINICIEKKIDFLLIAGDIYDGADRSLRAQLRFRDGLKRLEEAGIKTYIAHGNHDSLEGWSANLTWPNNVHIFKGKEVENYLFKKEGENFARIYSISFHKREIRTNLTNKFPKKSSKEDLFTIGMLHCNLGTNTGHEPYAPCTLQDLLSHNFDYWALGHVHNKQVINESNPLIIYAGNIQGRHPREIGSRGCFLVQVDQEGLSTYDFIEVDAIRWFVKEISIEPMTTEQDLLTGVERTIEDIRKEANGKPSICRIILTGRGVIHSSIIRKGFLDDILQDIRENEVGEKQFIWIESFINNTSSKIDRTSLLHRDDFIGDILKLFEESLHNKQLRDDLKVMLNPLFTSPSGRKLLEDIDDEEFTELLKKAESRSIDELMEE